MRCCLRPTARGSMRSTSAHTAFFYSFVIPFQTAWVASSDSRGRNAVMVPVAQGVGVSIGPMLAGYVAGTAGYSMVTVVSLLLLAASFCCVLVLRDPLERPASVRLQTRTLDQFSFVRQPLRRPHSPVQSPDFCGQKFHISRIIESKRM